MTTAAKAEKKTVDVVAVQEPRFIHTKWAVVAVYGWELITETVLQVVAAGLNLPFWDEGDHGVRYIHFSPDKPAGEWAHCWWDGGGMVINLQHVFDQAVERTQGGGSANSSMYSLFITNLLVCVFHEMHHMAGMSGNDGVIPGEEDDTEAVPGKTGNPEELAADIFGRECVVELAKTFNIEPPEYTLVPFFHSAVMTAVSPDAITEAAEGEEDMEELLIDWAEHQMHMLNNRLFFYRESGDGGASVMHHTYKEYVQVTFDGKEVADETWQGVGLPLAPLMSVETQTVVVGGTAEQQADMTQTLSAVAEAFGGSAAVAPEPMPAIPDAPPTAELPAAEATITISPEAAAEYEAIMDGDTGEYRNDTADVQLDNRIDALIAAPMDSVDPNVCPGCKKDKPEGANACPHCGHVYNQQALEEIWGVGNVPGQPANGIRSMTETPTGSKHIEMRDGVPVHVETFEQTKTVGNAPPTLQPVQAQPQTMTYPPTSLTDEEIVNVVTGLYFKAYNHIFSYCGQMTNADSGFSHPSKVHEMAIELDENEIQCIIKMDCLDANGRWCSGMPAMYEVAGDGGVPLIKGRLVGAVTKNTSLPYYKLYINRNGVELCRMLLPQNPAKQTNGQFTKTALAARAGSRILYIMEGNDHIVRAGGQKFIGKIIDGQLQVG